MAINPMTGSEDLFDPAIGMLLATNPELAIQQLIASGAEPPADVKADGGASLGKILLASNEPDYGSWLTSKGTLPPDVTPPSIGTSKSLIEGAPAEKGAGPAPITGTAPAAGTTLGGMLSKLLKPSATAAPTAPPAAPPPPIGDPFTPTNVPAIEGDIPLPTPKPESEATTSEAPKKTEAGAKKEVEKGLDNLTKALAGLSALANPVKPPTLHNQAPYHPTAIQQSTGAAGNLKGLEAVKLGIRLGQALRGA